MNIKEITVKSGNAHTNPINERDASVIECQLTATVTEGENVEGSLLMLQAMADAHVRKVCDKRLQDAEKNVRIASLESDIENMKQQMNSIGAALNLAEKMLSDMMEVKDETQPELPWGKDEEQLQGNEKIDVLDSGTGDTVSEGNPAGCVADAVNDMADRDGAGKKKTAELV